MKKIFILLSLTIVLSACSLVTLEPKIIDFQSCVAAGNPVMESYPRQCRANGQNFVEVIKNNLSASSDLTGNVYGQITTGPTCPVMRIPPDPVCADKPYQTAIQIIASGSPLSSPYKVINTDSQGNYSVTLPVGEYSFQPQGGNFLPRCTAQNVTVTSGANLKVDFSCDTGIR
jgi:hypothetical protein